MSAPTTRPGALQAPEVTAVAGITVHTGDLGRFRAFYEGLLGLSHVISLRMPDPPHLVHGIFAIGQDTALEAVEVPGFDGGDHGAADPGRGRFDHFSLLVEDDAALRAVRDRLVAAGASDGRVTTTGPYLSVRFRDPDGLEGTVRCPDQGFDPTSSGEEVLECSMGPAWTTALLARPPGSRDPDR